MGAPMSRSHIPQVAARTPSDQQTTLRQIMHHAMSTTIAQNKNSQNTWDAAPARFKTVSRYTMTMTKIPTMIGNNPLEAPNRASHGERRCKSLRLDSFLSTSFLSNPHHTQTTSQVH